MAKKKKKKLIPLTKSKPYVDFKRGRDTALEKLIHIRLVAVDQIIGKLKRKVLALITQRHAVDTFRVHAQGPIQHELRLASIQIAEMVRRLRAEAYLLSHSGEAEAIGRATLKVASSNPYVKLHKDKDVYGGGNIFQKMSLQFDRLGRKIQDALQMSHIIEEDPKERVIKAFPKTRKIKSTPALRKRKMKEAELHKLNQPDAIPDESGLGIEEQESMMMSTGITDENMWEDILADYRSEVLPADIFARGPEDKTLYYDVTTEEESERYTWEVEQEITEDFVRSVRSGEQDAANENGITDFMWLAVIDQKTDNCCFVRDGKSSSEIEEGLVDGSIDEDECDAIVAPAHFNCRCTSVPMDKDIPESQPIDYSDFDEWLEQKAAE